MGKKYTILSEINNEILDKVMREEERMSDAQDYLESLEKVRDDHALYEKIQKRNMLIDNYLSKKYSQVDDLLYKNKLKEQQRVEDKANEMEKKYKQ